MTLLMRPCPQRFAASCHFHGSHSFSWTRFASCTSAPDCKHFITHALELLSCACPFIGISEIMVCCGCLTWFSFQEIYLFYRHGCPLRWVSFSSATVKLVSC
jgi:hypothetical protein